MLHQRLVEQRWNGLFRRERVESVGRQLRAAPLTATLRLT